MCVTIFLQRFFKLLDNLILKLFYVCLKITHRVDIEKVIKQAESYSVDIADKTVGVHLKQIIFSQLPIAFTPKQSERRDHPRLAKFVEKINSRAFSDHCAGK